MTWFMQLVLKLFKAQVLRYYYVVENDTKFMFNHEVQHFLLIDSNL